jgi:hypothetical protein
MTVLDQVKKTQAQITENPTAKELIERLEVIADKLTDQAEALQSEFNERFESAQDELSERFEELTERFIATNKAMAETVTARLGSVPGADRFPQPASVVENYFDAIERITASNREFATKLVSPWSTAPAPQKKVAAPTKTTAKKATARKATAKKATARKTTARKTTARKTTASASPAAS